MSTDSTKLLAATHAPNYGSAQEAETGATSIQDRAVPETEYPGPLKLIPLSIAMGLAIFILGLDNTIVGTATPTITNEFHSLTGIGWYGSAYRVTTCSTQFFYGKLYEQFRVKWIFVASVIILELGSIVCASAPTSTAFIIGRAIAGSGASGIVTGVFIYITFGPAALEAYLQQHGRGSRVRCDDGSPGGWGRPDDLCELAMVVSGFRIAPEKTVHSLQTPLWEPSFWLNLPIGAFTIVIIMLLFKNPENQTIAKCSTVTKLRQLNIPNLFIFTASVVCLLMALEWGGTTYSWSSGRIIALLVVSGALFAGFVGLEAAQKDLATIPTSVVFNKTAGLCLLYAFGASAAFNVVDYFLPIWFQAIKGASAAESGQMLLPSIISLSVAAFSSGFIVSAIGYYTPHMLIGSPLMGIGSGLLTTLTPTSGPAAWIGWQVIFGLGMGFAITQPWSAIQTALAAKEVPLGMSAVSFAISIGAALSTSISQNVFANLLRRGLRDIPGVDADALIRQGATELLKAVPETEKAQVLDVYNFALTSTFWVCVTLVSLGMLAALCMDWNCVKSAEAAADDE
ncbi:MFS toxin efflux pump [Apiospora rasikravindrae]|uniref:MFS toxin efflux pump n=1 Tax=Apiospora rasikravindrae TaxID=990691 RepID=A0ABR1S0W8_9PEZI